MKILKSLKATLRRARNLLYLPAGCIYDACRFVVHSGIWFNGGAIKRDYKAVKIYHRIEKCLAFRNRRPSSGWDAASDFVYLMEKAKHQNDGLKFHELVGMKVLDDFVRASSVIGNDHSDVIEYVKANSRLTDFRDQGGVKRLRARDVQLGILDDPEKFFLSRHSVRDYKSIAVEKEIIYRALSLALKTPSVCNRQAWFVYHLDTRPLIDAALMLQNGNRGFGHEIPCLLIVAADLSAFDTPNERYQHWIDGGMFAMSLVLSLHSLGLASCCLNWDQGPLNDMRLRNAIPLKSRHTVIMMIAVGYCNDEINVCYSARKPWPDFYEYLGNPE